MHIIPLLFGIILFFSITIVLFSLYVGITPMPSSLLTKKAMLKECATGGDRVYELGSGWGGVAFAIARRFSHKQIHAFELSWLPYLYARFKLKMMPLENLHFYNKDFLKVSLRQADQIVCYLSPRIMQKLRLKFEQELQPGALVISNYFSVQGWEAEKIHLLDDFWGSNIYLYRVGIGFMDTGEG